MSRSVDCVKSKRISLIEVKPPAPIAVSCVGLHQTIGLVRGSELSCAAIAAIGFQLLLSIAVCDRHRPQKD